MDKFKYVDVLSPGCAGWLNLFFGEYCVALVNNAQVANRMRNVIEPATNDDKLSRHVEPWKLPGNELPEPGVKHLCCDNTGNYFEAHVMGIDDEGEAKWSCPHTVYKWLDGPTPFESP